MPPGTYRGFERRTHGARSQGRRPAVPVLLPTAPEPGRMGSGRAKGSGRVDVKLRCAALKKSAPPARERGSIALRVFVELALQRAAVHAEGARGGRDVAAVRREHVLNVLPCEPGDR